MDSVLEEAEAPWGGQRFYPPGQHPALQSDREMLERLEELGVLPTDVVWAAQLGREISVTERPELAKAIEYHRDRIAAFEESESLAKHGYLRRCA